MLHSPLQLTDRGKMARHSLANPVRATAHCSTGA